MRCASSRGWIQKILISHRAADLPVMNAAVALRRFAQFKLAIRAA
jgi:hypothetical protein